MMVDKKFCFYNITPTPLTLSKIEVSLQELTYCSEAFVIVRPLAVGVCRSDIKELEGKRTSRSDFGHEVVGEIIEVSKNVKHAVGDIVLLWPEIKIKRTSGFGELIVAEGTAEELNIAFIKVNPSLPYKRLVLCEPMSCAWHCIMRLLQSLKRASLKGTSIAILGAGNAGTLMGLIVEHFGGHVMLFNRGMDRITFLREKGIFADSLVRPMGELTEFEDNFDAVIVTSTFLDNDILSAAMLVVAPKQPVILFGGTNKGFSISGIQADIDQLRRQELTRSVRLANGKEVNLVGTYGSNEQDFEEVLQLINSNVGIKLEALFDMEVAFEHSKTLFQNILLGKKLQKIIINF